MKKERARYCTECGKRLCGSPKAMVCSAKCRWKKARRKKKEGRISWI